MAGHCIFIVLCVAAPSFPKTTYKIGQVWVETVISIPPPRYALREPVCASGMVCSCGPMSFPSFFCLFQGSPSTCVVDSALIPLPSFLLVVFGGFILLRRPHDRLRIIIPRWIHIVYMVLLGAAIGMTLVVVARNTAEHLGMGLIPMVLIGLILVFVGLCHEIKGRSLSLSAVSDFF